MTQQRNPAPSGNQQRGPNQAGPQQRDPRDQQQRGPNRPLQDRQPQPRPNNQPPAVRQQEEQGQQNQQRTIVPVSQGTIGAITPTTQRNFIHLVSTNSATAKRGEAPPGVFYSRNLGQFDTLKAEVLGCFYRQRYQIWDDRAQIFRTYCEAAAASIEELWGNGQPGGKCTECNLTQWREVPVEGTSEVKNQPPPCGENVVFDLFIHDCAARAFWEVGPNDNLNSIRNTINILNERMGWGQYVIELYSTMQMSSRNEPRFSPHVRFRPDLKSFASLTVVDAQGNIVAGDAETRQPDQIGNQPFHPDNWPDEPPPQFEFPADEEYGSDFQAVDDLPY